MKKLVAYSSVSHLGFVMLGIFALNPPGINGGVLQMINHGISTGALFLLVGIIYERRHTRMIAEYGGLSAADAGLRHALPDHHHVVDRAAGAQRLHRRVHDPGRRLPPHLVVGGAGGASASCWAPPTCCGCTSGSSSARSTIPRTRACRTSTAASSPTCVPLVVLCFWIGLYPQAVLRRAGEVASTTWSRARRTPRYARRRAARRPSAAATAAGVARRADPQSSSCSAPEILLATAGLLLLLLVSSIGRGLGNRESAGFAVLGLALTAGLRGLAPARAPPGAAHRSWPAPSSSTASRSSGRCWCWSPPALTVLLSVRFVEEAELPRRASTTRCSSSPPAA